MSSRGADIQKHGQRWPRCVLLAKGKLCMAGVVIMPEVFWFSLVTTYV